MDCTGEVKSIFQDFETGEWNVTFKLDKDGVIQTINTLGNMMKKKLSIKVGEYRKKRSLDANAYFHVLVGKIADTETISKAKAKNILICKYGQPQLLPDGSPMVYKTNAPVDYMMELESIHSIPIKYSEENGKEVVFYKIYRGSHTLDSYEMSKLIEGTVADAKELGIETLTPRELATMYQNWGKKK